MDTYPLTSLIAGLSIVILIFLISRGFWCWFFRINEAIKFLKMMDERDAKILHTLIEINNNLKK